MDDYSIVISKFVHSNTLADDEPNWSDVDKTKLPRIAFAEQGEEDKVSSWGLPHHFVKNGGNEDEGGRYTTGTLYLHRGGVMAAYAALQGAHGTKPDVSETARKHIEAHRNYIMSLEKQDYLAKIDQQLHDKKNQVFFRKIDPIRKLVTGIVYEPNEVDAHGHYMTSEEIELMSHRFMIAYSMGQSGIDFMHNGQNGSGIVVESFIAYDDYKSDKDEMIWKKGAWVLTTKVLDEDIWQKILSNDITGYSMAGNGEYGKGSYQPSQQEPKQNDNEVAKSIIAMEKSLKPILKNKEKIIYCLVNKIKVPNTVELIKWCALHCIDHELFQDLDDRYVAVIYNKEEYNANTLKSLKFDDTLTIVVGELNNGC